MTKPSIIIVDDDPVITSYIAEIMSEMGYATTQVASGKALLNLAEITTPCIVILDVVMPDMDGIEVLQALSEWDGQTSVILMSGYHEHYIDIANTLGKAQGLKIIGTLRKPFSPDELKNILFSIEG